MNSLDYLKKYKNVMDAYRRSVRFGRIKEDYELPFHLNMLKEHLMSGNYMEAVNSLEDIVLCYDMDDPKIEYMTADILKECEEYVDELIEKQR